MSVKDKSGQILDAPEKSRQKHKPYSLDYLILLVLTLIWGSSFIIYKEALKEFSWMQVGQIRIVIGAVCMIPFLQFSWANRPKNLIPIVLVGIFGSGLPPFLFAIAQTELESAPTGMLNAFTPVWTLILGILMYNLHVSKQQVYGLFAGLFGAMVIIGQGLFTESSGNWLFGFFVLAATLCYGLSTNIIKGNLQTVHPLAIGSLGMLSIGIPAAAFLPFSGVPEILSSGNPDAWKALGYIAILASLGTAGANVLYFVLVQRTHVVFASVITYLIPIVAILWGIGDGEKISALDYVGFLLILSGVWLAGRTRKS
jgi:drug/metabolite transporter (DMT)-like permease